MKAAAAFTLLSAAMAAAMPAALMARQDPEGDEIWKSDDGKGNIQISIGDVNIPFGHLVPSSVLDGISEECSSSTCQAGKDIKRETRYVTVRGIMGIMTNVKMTVQAQFAPDGNHGDKNQLVSIAKSVMQGLYQNGVAEREEGVPYRTKPCQQTPTQGCRYTEDLSYVDQWKSTNNVNVQVTRDMDDGSPVIAGFLNVSFELEDDGGGDGGICSTVAGFGSTLAGVVNSAAGTGMSLLSVFCVFA